MTKHDSYQKLHQIIGVKISLTSLGFDALLECFLILCALRIKFCDRLYSRIPDILHLGGVGSISVIISAVIFDKNLIWQSLASFLLGMTIIMGGLFLFDTIRKFVSRHESDTAADEVVIRASDPGFFQRRHSLQGGAPSNGDTAQLAEEGLCGTVFFQPVIHRDAHSRMELTRSHLPANNGVDDPISDLFDPNNFHSITGTRK